MELESLKQGSKALVSFPNASPGKGKGKGKEKKEGKGGGSHDRPSGLSHSMEGSEQVKVCFRMRDTRKCEFGEKCHYSHEPAAVAKAKKEMKVNAQKEKAETEKADKARAKVVVRAKGRRMIRTGFVVTSRRVRVLVWEGLQILPQQESIQR